MTELKTFPPLLDVLVAIYCGLVITALGPGWLTTAYRVGTALWLLTFVYGAIRNYARKKATR